MDDHNQASGRNRLGNQRSRRNSSVVRDLHGSKVEHDIRQDCAADSAKNLRHHVADGRLELDGTLGKHHERDRRVEVSATDGPKNENQKG